MICENPPGEQSQILGVWFSATKDCSSTNTNAIELKMSSTMEQWSQRDLTIKGKVTVIKSLIMSQLVPIYDGGNTDRK